LSVLRIRAFILTRGYFKKVQVLWVFYKEIGQKIYVPLMFQYGETNEVLPLCNKLVAFMIIRPAKRLTQQVC
jgi:hypothetical protein